MKEGRLNGGQGYLPHQSRKMVKKTLFLICLLILLICYETTGSNLSPNQAEPGGRYQHYVFAHRALPSVIFSCDEKTLMAFETNGQVFVQRVWDAVGKEARKAGQSMIDSNGLEFSVEHIGYTKLYLIRLPEPVVPPEAFYVAAVVQDGKATKFFTLEKTFCPTETPQCDNTVLGGWTKNGIHVNYGIGPAPIKEHFLSALKEKL